MVGVVVEVVILGLVHALSALWRRYMDFLKSRQTELQQAFWFFVPFVLAAVSVAVFVWQAFL